MVIYTGKYVTDIYVKLCRYLKYMNNQIKPSINLKVTGTHKYLMSSTQDKVKFI